MLNRVGNKNKIMAHIINKSKTSDLYGTVWSNPPNPAPTSPAWSLAPGQEFFITNPPHALPAYQYFFPKDKTVSDRTPYYEGYIRQSYEVDVDPDTKKVSFVGQYLTERDLLAFQKLYPNDPKIQALTLDELKDKYKPDEFRGNNVDVAVDSSFVRDISITDCQYDIAIVVIDCIFALTGAVGLAGKVSGSAVETVAKTIQPAMNEIEEAVHTLSIAASKYEKAEAIKNIVHIIWSGSMIEAVYHAIMNSLTWWDMVIYSVLGIATISAAFLTDGAALVAMFVAEIALCAFVISDAVKAVNSCNLTIQQDL